MKSRRDFVKITTLAGASTLLPFSMQAGRLGFSANDTVNVAVIGLRNRAYALVQSLSSCENARVTHVCDVDRPVMDKHFAFCEEQLGYRPTTEHDFRRLLDNPDIDAVFIATPEHWHAPMAIMALQAGKHVYVEKPCSHNPRENELLVEAQIRYGGKCQMGNQQRSSVTSNQAMRDIQDGLIGEVYYAKCWYSNTRGSIGTGKVVPVPDTLDWDLWQGPAPREAYRDNVHPYNWHWFRTWGTGEIHNNGTHEIDICRWALGVGLPTKVSSTGGRLHFTNDDWEFFDTQTASYEFAGGKQLVWEGRSCNGFPHYGTGRGSTIHGTKGTIMLDREVYRQYDLGGELVAEHKEQVTGSSQHTSDTAGFDYLTVLHIQNFINGIVRDEALNAEIKEASISTQLCHLGNIAQFGGETLEVDPVSGKVSGSRTARKMWSREYEKGWEVKV